ncbi:MAG: hypothetical protein U5K37_05100 [Natrialbaceae archaeon]|nr:hypothetical protein [Natrialbaceae archaeon]
MTLWDPMNATIVVNGHQIPSQISADGEFSITYRPTDERLGDQSVSIKFIPPAQSTYLPAETNVTATIEQVSPAFDSMEIERARIISITTNGRWMAGC